MEIQGEINHRKGRATISLLTEGSVEQNIMHMQYMAGNPVCFWHWCCHLGYCSLFLCLNVLMNKNVEVHWLYIHTPLCGVSNSDSCWQDGTLGFNITLTSDDRQLSHWLHLWVPELGERPTMGDTDKKCPVVTLSRQSVYCTSCQNGLCLVPDEMTQVVFHMKTSIICLELISITVATHKK